MVVASALVDASAVMTAEVEETEVEADAVVRTVACAVDSVDIAVALEEVAVRAANVLAEIVVSADAALAAALATAVVTAAAAAWEVEAEVDAARVVVAGAGASVVGGGSVGPTGGELAVAEVTRPARRAVPGRE